MLWGLLAVVAALLWIVTIFDIVKRHLGAKMTAAWILIVVILPFVGAIGYWILRRPTAEEVQRRMDTDRNIREGAKAPRILP